MARSTASWREVGFDEAFQRLKLKAFEIPTKDYQVAGTYPIIDQGDGAIAGYINREDPISDVPFIVFGDHTTIVKYVDRPCFIGSQGVVPLKARECYDPYFLYLMLGRTRIPALGYSRHFRELENKTFPLPPLAEQRKIAEILRTWDEAIEAAEAELKAKQERKRWLTRKFFSPSLMSAGVENTKNEWPKRPLGELTEVLDGKRKPISKEFRKPGPFPYYGACGVVDYIDAHLFDEPLVLVGEDGAKWGAGESTAFIVNGKCWVNNHAHVLRPNRDVIMDYWMMSWLNFRDLSEYVSGLTVPKLNQANLRAIPIPVPPLLQQSRFVEVLQASDVDIEALSKRILSLRAQKRGLMQKLLTGEVRIAA